MFSQYNSQIMNECLACGSTHLKKTLDLGEQPLANSYKKTKDEKQDVYPLVINHCTHCYHVQLTHAVNPELMFKDYAYVSGTSETMAAHFKWFAEWVTEYYKSIIPRAPYEVLDIGCNDGSQLNYFQNLAYTTYGVDPAENLYPISSKRHKVFPVFFDAAFAEDKAKVSTTYDVIVAQNVFAHNYDPVTFMQAAKTIMSNQSLMFIQTSQADMIKNNEFDTIYHEHISFYNINSMKELCKRTGMFVIDVVKCPLHGNSYIFVVSRNPDHARPAHIRNLITMESYLLKEETYDVYREKCEKVASVLKSTMLECGNPDAGFYLVGYGAAAKGMTLLNYTGIHLDYIIDDNPLKQNKFTPGSSIPIVSFDILTELKGPCVFVPLAWNFFDEIREKIKRKRDNEFDLFVRYFPEVKVTK